MSSCVLWYITDYCMPSMTNKLCMRILSKSDVQRLEEKHMLSLTLTKWLPSKRTQIVKLTTSGEQHNDCHQSGFQTTQQQCRPRKEAFRSCYRRRTLSLEVISSPYLAKPLRLSWFAFHFPLWLQKEDLARDRGWFPHLTEGKSMSCSLPTLSQVLNCNKGAARFISKTQHRWVQTLRSKKDVFDGIIWSTNITIYKVAKGRRKISIQLAFCS